METNLVRNPSRAQGAHTHTRKRARAHARELTVVGYRLLYADCERYARKWFIRYRMPLSDLEDVISIAVDDAYERVCRKREVTNLEAFMRICAYRAVSNAIARRKYRCNLIWIDAIPITRPVRDETNEDDELVEEGFFVSDEGKGAADIRACAEDDEDPDRQPDWVYLFRMAMARQVGKAKKVLRALRKDSRPAVAVGLSGLSRATFFRSLQKIRIDFSQCFQAFREKR